MLDRTKERRKKCIKQTKLLNVVTLWMLLQNIWNNYHWYWAGTSVYIQLLKFIEHAEFIYEALSSLGIKM